MSVSNGIVNRGMELNDEEIVETKIDENHRIIKIERPHYSVCQLQNEFEYTKLPEKPALQIILEHLRRFKPLQFIIHLFPVIFWMKKYKKDYVVGDILSGITVAIMHIPQGYGFALLAKLPPIIGIYTAFFNGLVYFVLGTSRHNSMGTFAVIAIMVGDLVTRYTKDGSSSPIEIATLLCFTVGIMHLLMFALRLGVVANLLSAILISSVTSGAAFHVLTSQLKDLLGLDFESPHGNFNLVKMYIQVFTDIGKVNLATILITVISIALLIFNYEFLKSKLLKITSIPFPIELVLVVAGTLIAQYFNLYSKYSVKLIGDIQIGLPTPHVPDLGLASTVLIGSLSIAIVSYSPLVSLTRELQWMHPWIKMTSACTSVSMALLLAEKYNYKIDFNQEFLALGVINIVGSFFSCMPSSTSLARSLVQEQVGGKTQMSTLVCCILLLLILLVIGPFFENSPRCILACIIVVALKPMLMLVTDFWKFRKQHPVDGYIWLLTFLTVVLVNIDIGLIVGMALNILSMMGRNMRPNVCLMGNIPNTDFYVDKSCYKKAVEIPGVKIFRYSGNLNYVNRNLFKMKLCESLEIDLAKEFKYCENEEFKSNINFKHLIVDFSGLSNIDIPATLTMLEPLISSFAMINVKVYLVSNSVPIIEMLKKIKMSSDLIYPTIHDAVNKILDI